MYHTNKLICNDNLDELPKINSESIDLVYIDPPFFSNRNYEVIWGDEAEIRSFEDRWEGGINVYVEWMKQRVIEINRVLKSTGTFFLHCDWHASHYLKVMCDDVFGAKNFRNEIIWSYKRYTAASKMFQRLHDVILFYSKSDEYTFNDIRIPYGEKSGKADSHYKQDEEGKWFRWQKRKGEKPYKVYLSDGRRMGDVWEISIINASAKERLGYPTQKPETLLEQIIKSGSNEGDIILDAFCGCGTSLAVAQKLNRKWYGIDISPTAINMVKNRMKIIGVNSKDIDIIGMPKTIKDLQRLKPFEFQYWVINEMHGSPSPRKSGDMGIDGLSYLTHNPIQVKQSEGVGRNVIDNFETALKRYYGDKHKGTMIGYIVAYSFGSGAKEEVARAKKDGYEIILIEAQEILDKKFTLKMSNKRAR